MTSYKCSHQSKHNVQPCWNIGYTTREHLCIDLDNTSKRKVFGLVELIMQYYPCVGHCLILKSSSPSFKYVVKYVHGEGIKMLTTRHNFHVIFDNIIGYDECCHIIETLAHLGVINEEYIRIRRFRNDMTVRVSKTVLLDTVKEAPTPVAYVQNGMEKKRGEGIDRYLNFYFLVNRQ